ncbi:uncharacterized protein LOC136076893 [Hydra vulgaris]|uniref:Uncharacterized protein LOC136076893 n=1 Tax=Hydra vulgaris TaxID=6087 RepID=A0ABM4BCR5_HYDVU
MSNIFDNVRIALERSDIVTLEEINKKLSLEVDSLCFLTQENLHLLINQVHLKRNICANAYLSKNAKSNKLVPILSSSSGNCLYCSVSLVIVGNNLLVDILRVLTSMELFINADFYSKDPIFNDIINSGKYNFFSYDIILKMTLSKIVVDQDITKNKQCVRSEAINNCFENQWSSFMCILGLSSVVNSHIFCHYPEFGLDRFFFSFNRLIKPRVNKLKPIRNKVINIMFCRIGMLPSGFAFTPNHFVPLDVYDFKESRKRNFISFMMPAKLIKFDETPTKEKKQLFLNFLSSKGATKLSTTSELDLSAKDSFSGDTIKCLIVPNVESSIDFVNKSFDEFDVANFQEQRRELQCNKMLFCQKILHLVKNAFIPDNSFNFPQGKNNRKFSMKWLETFSWLCYSKKLNGGFC